MIPAKKHKQEAARLAALDSYNILDSLPEQDYEDLVKLASKICGTPMSIISLIDEERQWFKAKKGLEAGETHRDLAFCAHAILQDEVFVVEDAKKDERFWDNPLVTGSLNLGFYAGVPLVGKEGLPLGTLCVLDEKSRTFSEEEKEALEILGRQVMRLFELRKKQREVEEALAKEQKRHAELERFAKVALKDLRTPMRNIASVTRLLLSDGKLALPDTKRQMMEKVLQSADRLKSMLEGLWNYNHANKYLEEELKDIPLLPMQQHFQLAYGQKAHLEWDMPPSLYYRPKLFKLLIDEVIDNSCRFAQQDVVWININLSETSRGYHLKITDNGPGIKAEALPKAKELFFSEKEKDKNGQPCHGIGLALLEKVLQKEGGSINLFKAPKGGLVVALNIPHPDILEAKGATAKSDKL
ncbi:signal transduction histidine kinase [Saprospira grandis DSM 2844]|uniref:histidine kinase n=1 Tax=Saprospira grandis DSM 2844 TaxID=694433 RepID=J0P5F6_9BACT|nr:GAF domain-containing sensor histidine kinase [Saprospira grandis]EJF55104.1 signal transduction histidine kinase [Saprospira grandis DSM 2844]